VLSCASTCTAVVLRPGHRKHQALGPTSLEGGPAYPGCPQGMSEAELAAGAYAQAVRFGAEVVVGVELMRVAPELESGAALVEHLPAV